VTDNAHAEHQLDQWLGIELAALCDTLDNVLDLDAGLADAQLPAIHAALTQALEDVLDLDFGLGTIVPTADTSRCIASTDDESTTTPNAPSTLSEFTDALFARPAHARLSARTWFPLQQLATARSIAHLVARARILADDLNRAITNAGLIAAALQFKVSHPRADAAILDRALDRARAEVCALTHGLAQVRGLEGTHAVCMTLGINLAHVPTITQDPTRAHHLLQYLHPAIGRAGIVARELGRALTYAMDDLGRALHLDHDLTDPSEVGHDVSMSDLIAIVDRLDIAISNMTGADLTHVDLKGIPLEGLRWSISTSWPTAWTDTIRQNSVEIQPGVYEVRHGGVNTKLVIDTTFGP
jgi:hypothetical protein